VSCREIEISTLLEGLTLQTLHLIFSNDRKQKTANLSISGFSLCGSEIEI